MTVAMILAKNGIIPPKEWYHDPNLVNNEGRTVCYFLFINSINIPI